MKPTLELRITPRLASRFHSMLGGMPLKDPVLAIAQHRRDGSADLRLGVGVYERTLLPNDAMIVEVGQLKFYVDPSMEAMLENGTLDVVDDEFTIIQA